MQKKPIIIAISGFGGSGKSTLAHQLAEALGDTPVISIDAFARDHLSQRSSDWEGFDFERLINQVLIPAHEGKEITYDVYDWLANAPTTRCTIHPSRYLILEGCGLIQAKLLPYFATSIWLDVPLEVATARGITRDQAGSLPWIASWTTIWQPNEQDFYNKHAPKQHAETVLGMNDTVKTLLCPCCQRTLRKLDAICPLCNWQFDGQDDTNADEVLGGPNGDLSLTEARRIFQEHNQVVTA